VALAAWGTLQLYRDRSLGQKDENEWGFGQVIAVVMLVAPLLARFGHLREFRFIVSVKASRPCEPPQLSLNIPSPNISLSYLSPPTPSLNNPESLGLFPGKTKKIPS